MIDYIIGITIKVQLEKLHNNWSSSSYDGLQAYLGCFTDYCLCCISILCFLYRVCFRERLKKG